MKGKWVDIDGREPKGVCEMDTLVCSVCGHGTFPRIVRWEENGIKYGRYVQRDFCPNCFADMRGIDNE